MLSFSAPTWQPTQKAEPTRVVREKRKPVASPVIPGRLFLSDFLTAADAPTLKRLKVTHVLSVLETPPTFSNISKRPLKTLHVDIGDSIGDDILSRLPETTQWITEAMAEEDSVVLVHCMMGVSRSATVVCAYLMASQHLSAANALARVRAVRGIVRPNPAFARQLEAYAAAIEVQTSTVDVGPPKTVRSSLAHRILRTIRSSQDKPESSSSKSQNEALPAVESTDTPPVGTQAGASDKGGK
jgi:atypical dual specificity phosphatase